MFRSGANLKLAWDYYLFDRRLRMLIMDAIERIEISFRTCIAYEWALFTSCDSPHALINVSQKFQEHFSRSDEPKALELKKTGIISVNELPVWDFIEFSTFGCLTRLYSASLPQRVQENIANRFGFQQVSFFTSIMKLILKARNTVAHHGRVWNRRWTQAKQRSQSLPIVRSVPKEEWGEFAPERTAFLLMALHVLLQHSANTSQWDKRLVTLLRDNPPSKAIEKELGFARDFTQQKLWLQDVQ